MSVLVFRGIDFRQVTIYDGGMGVTQCWCGHLLTRARNSPGHRSSKGTPTSVRSNVPHVSHVIKVKSTCFFCRRFFFARKPHMHSAARKFCGSVSPRSVGLVGLSESYQEPVASPYTPPLCLFRARPSESVCHRGSATCQLFRAEPEDRECDGDEGDHHHHDDGGGAHMHRCHTWPADTGVRIDTPFIWHKGESVVVL
jgi:hypothetical protein